MLKHIEADVQISENHIQRVSVPEWEIPILQAVHPMTDIVVKGEVSVNRAPPDAADEFRRLANRYGHVQAEDGGKGAAFVASVYGQFGVGNNALAQAIAKATLTAPAAPSFDDLLGGEQPVSSVGG